MGILDSLLGYQPPAGGVLAKALAQNPNKITPGTLADIIQKGTGWRPGTTPSWMPQAVTDLSKSNQAAEDASRANASKMGSYGMGPDRLNYLMGFAGPVEAWHGSPHSFDAFDASKIGTGEGSQSYGYGIYTAENPKVAQHYADSLSEPGFTVTDKNPDGTHGDAFHIVDHKTGEVKGSYPTFEEADAAAAKMPSTGSLYHVKINAEPEHFLDWDKSFDKQTPDIQQKLASVFGADAIRPGVYADVRSPEVSRRLSEAGIPGIRYLDQGSRGAGEGTHNYVVFDPKKLSILEKR